MKTKLPREILTLVNRKSHALGLEHAEKEKKRLITELEQLRTDGMGLQELQKYLEAK